MYKFQFKPSKMRNSRIFCGEQLSETANTIGYMIEKSGLAGGFKTNYSSVKWNAKYVLVFPVNGGSYTEFAFLGERLEKLRVNVSSF